MRLCYHTQLRLQQITNRGAARCRHLYPGKYPQPRGNANATVTRQGVGCSTLHILSSFFTVHIYSSRAFLILPCPTAPPDTRAARYRQTETLGRRVPCAVMSRVCEKMHIVALSLAACRVCVVLYCTCTFATSGVTERPCESHG